MTKRELVKMLDRLDDDEVVYIERRGELFEVCAGGYETVRYDLIIDGWVLKEGVGGIKKKKFVLDA